MPLEPILRKEYVQTALYNFVLKDLIRLIIDYVCNDYLELEDCIRYMLNDTNYNSDIKYKIKSWDRIVIEYPFSSTRISTIFIEISLNYKVTGYLGDRDYVGHNLSVAFPVFIRSWLFECTSRNLVDDVADLVHKITEVVYYYKTNIMYESIKDEYRTNQLKKITHS